MTAIEDRAVQALIADGWLGDECPVGGHDLAAAVGLVLRVVRDDLVRAHRLGDVTDVPDAALWLSARVEDLTGVATDNGDTDPSAAPAPVLAWLTVDDHGLIMDDSTVTVGEWTGPVPERASNGMRLAPLRLAETLRAQGWRMAEGVDDTTRPGMVGIPVEKIKEG